MLKLIGPVRLCDDDADVTPRSRKGRALLAILALSPASVSRDELAGLLWSDRGEEQARASLRQCLTELRGGVLGRHDALEVGRGGVQLRSELVRLDVDEAVHAARVDDLGTLSVMLSAGNLELMTGLDGLAPGLDDWLRVERARRREMLIEAAIAAADRVLTAGRAAGVSALIAELERIDPGNEVVARLGFRADHASGDAASLHRRLQRLARTLEHEFGVAPSEETRRLFENLRAGAPVALAAPAQQAVDAPPLLHVGEFVDATQGQFAHVAAALRFEVLAGLSRFRDLRLAADREPSQPGDYSLKATVRPSLGGLAIAPQLLRHGGALVWAERLDLRLDELQEGVELIIGRMVAAILPAVMSDVLSTLRPRAAGNLYSRYLVAKQASLRPPDHETALATARELEDIIAADPRFVSPKLALARVYDTDFVWTRAKSSGPAERGRAFELSRQALALDHDDVNAWTHVGWSHLWHGNWAAAEQAFQSALTLNPYNGPRLLLVAFGRIYLGTFDQSAALIERCLAIEPRASDGLLGDRGLLLMMQGDCDAAAADFDMIAAPDLLQLVHGAANAALAGRLSAAQRDRAMEALAHLFPNGRRPAPDEILDWACACHPFRHAAHRDYFLGGLASAFG